MGNLINSTMGHGQRRRWVRWCREREHGCLCFFPSFLHSCEAFPLAFPWWLKMLAELFWDVWVPTPPPPKIICLRPDFCRFWQGSYHNLVALELFDVLCFFLCGMWCGVVWHFGSGTLPQIFTQRLVQGAGGAPKK